MEGRTNNAPNAPDEETAQLYDRNEYVVCCGIVVLFDLGLLERLEWPTMVISELSFACKCIRLFIIHGTHH